MTERPYAAAAPSYLESGWHPLPVPWGKKGPPPLGMTGHDGHPPTMHTVRMWRTKPAFEDKARGNICLVMSDEVIGIDVDHYGGKTGGDTLAELEKRLGPLPATALSTARDDKISGIRFYRVPAGRKWKESAGKDIEIIQRVHRYAMVWPSTHPEGWIYRWFWSDNWQLIADRVPPATQLPMLPDAWVEEFTDQAEYVKPSERVSFTEQDAEGILTGGKPCPAMRNALDEYAGIRDAAARHKAMIKVVFKLIRLGEQGHDGANSALEALREVFLDDVGTDRRGLDKEFQRAADGGIGKVLAEPTREDDKGCCPPTQAERDEAFTQYATADSGEAHVNGDHPRERTSWWPVDLGSVLAGDWRRPEPTIGKRRDGRGLFYKGKSHLVVGETESAKTWFTLAAAWDEILAGNHVVFIDFEDDEGTIVDRLRATAPPFDLIRGEYQTDEVIKQYFHYIRPEGSLRVRTNVEDLAEVMHTFQPTLVINDGTTEAMAMHDLNLNDNIDVARFNSLLVKPVVALGAANVLLDHVVKSKDDRGRYAIGGVHKLNAVSGAAYLLVNRQPLGVGLTGRSTILISKDRPGQLRPHGLPSTGGLHAYGDLVMESRDQDHAQITIWPPKEKDDAPERPTRLMAKIVELLAAKGALSQRRILAGVSGNTDQKRWALDLLILDGYVSDKTPHELIKPWQEQET